nr:CoA protein activase [Anaerolineae bacterium]
MTSLRVAFPPLGSLSLAAEGYIRALGLEVVSPPPTSRRTLDLGVAHCPEMVCIPCKLLSGRPDHP